MEENDAIVKKYSEDILKEMVETFKYVLCNLSNIQLAPFREYSDRHYEKIKDMKVDDLDDTDKIFAMVYWLLGNESFDDKFRSKITPDLVMHHLTDSEVVTEFRKRWQDPNSSVIMEINPKCREGF